MACIKATISTLSSNNIYVLCFLYTNIAWCHIAKAKPNWSTVNTRIEELHLSDLRLVILEAKQVYFINITFQSKNDL